MTPGDSSDTRQAKAAAVALALLPAAPKKKDNKKKKKKKAKSASKKKKKGDDDSAEKAKRRKVNFALSPQLSGRGPHYRRKFILSFGINRYAHRERLGCAAPDARALAAYFSAHLGFDDAVCLLNERCTKAAVEKEIKNRQTEIGKLYAQRNKLADKITKGLRG